MKKIIALILSAIMLMATLTACGENKDSQATTQIMNAVSSQEAIIPSSFEGIYVNDNSSSKQNDIPNSFACSKIPPHSSALSMRVVFSSLHIPFALA